MKARDGRSQIRRIVWLATIALGLVTWMASTAVLADGSVVFVPDPVEDSTDTTHGCVAPDTVTVVGENQVGTTSTIFWELWGLLF
jgi:hypothetical protein